MASHKVRFVDQVGGFDLCLAETQMGDRNTTGFLGVIIKVCLYVLIGVVADDLDGVLVSTDSTVCSQSPELAVDDGFRNGDRIVGAVQRQVGDIVSDTNGELALFCILEDSDDLCSAGVLGT